MDQNCAFYTLIHTLCKQAHIPLYQPIIKRKLRFCKVVLERTKYQKFVLKGTSAVLNNTCN